MHEIITNAETHQILQIKLQKKNEQKNQKKMMKKCISDAKKTYKKNKKNYTKKKQAYQSNQREARKSPFILLSNALCYFDDNDDGDNKILKHFSCKICLDLVKGSRSNLKGRTERSPKCPKQFRFIRVVS